MNQIEKAIQVALDAHTGQVDKGGNPYIIHPFHVAMKQRTDDGFVVGMLHDVIEDSDYTLEALEREGFSQPVLEALELLTHKEDENYFDYINRLKDNELAREVKIADLEHNCDLKRIKDLVYRDFNRVEKYQKALDILNAV